MTMVEKEQKPTNVVGEDGGYHIVAADDDDDDDVFEIFQYIKTSSSDIIIISLVEMLHPNGQHYY